MAAALSDPLRVIILGGGTAGWMTANLMAHHWGERAQVTVVESPDVGIVGVGEGSTPQLKAFFDHLGIAEATWMPRCNATYKNGISFHGWSERPGFARYFHPFLTALDPHTAPAFFGNAALRRRGADVCAHPDRFFVLARLAADRLAPLAPDRFPFASPISSGMSTRSSSAPTGTSRTSSRPVGKLSPAICSWTRAVSTA